MPFDQVYNPQLPQRILIDIILEKSSYVSIKSEKKIQHCIIHHSSTNENRMDLE